MYLDSDFVTVRRVVLTEARELLEELEIDPARHQPQRPAPGTPPIHFARQPDLPDHRPDPARSIRKRFVAKIVWEGRELGQGEGRSKKEAETAAARNALAFELWKSSASSVSDNSADNPPITRSSAK